MLTTLFAPALVFATVHANQSGNPAPNPVAGYRDSAALIAAAHELATAHADKVHLDVIGRSRGNRELVALTLGTSAAHPAILVTGGLDGTSLVSSETALRLAKLIVETKPELLERATFYIIPLANPDALDATLQGLAPQVGALRPVDDDRDGTIDEDGPRDLDGDGVITQVRVKDPKPPYVAAFVTDATEARLMKAPDAAKGDVAVYALFTEGVDADGDGRIAEDGTGQVDLNHNFPHRYPEFAPDAGPHQISEPESLALTKFVVAHRDIVAALTYGRHDTLVKVPETKDMDPTGRAPMVYLTADHPTYLEIGKLYRELTAQKRAAMSDDAGAFWLWLADHRGLLSIASVVWGRPDVPKDEKEEKKDDAKEAAPVKDAESPKVDAPKSDDEAIHDDEEDEHRHGPFVQQAPPTPPTSPPAAQPGAPQGAPQGTPQGTPPAGGRRGGRGPGGRGPGGAAPSAPPSDAKAADGDASEWLAYIDKMRGGVGFVAWHAFEHPQFGAVEIGGFHPLFRLNPPSEELDALAEKQLAFVAALVERLPKLETAAPVVTKLADDVWRIETSVVNVGKLPTATKMGRTARSVDPVVVRISTPMERIVSGQRVRIIDGLDPGERTSLAWTVRAAPDEEVSVSVGCGALGTQVFTIRNGTVEGNPSHG